MEEQRQKIAKLDHWLETIDNELKESTKQVDVLTEEDITRYIEVYERYIREYEEYEIILKSITIIGSDKSSQSLEDKLKITQQSLVETRNLVIVEIERLRQVLLQMRSVAEVIEEDISQTDRTIDSTSMPEEVVSPRESEIVKTEKKQEEVPSIKESSPKIEEEVIIPSEKLQIDKEEHSEELPSTKGEPSEKLSTEKKEPSEMKVEHIVVKEEKPTITIETQTGQSLRSESPPVTDKSIMCEPEKIITQDVSITCAPPHDIEVQTSEPISDEKEILENIKVRQTIAGDHEIFEIESRPVVRDQKVHGQSLLVDANYRDDNQGKDSQLNITHSLPQSFETVMVEPDETTTEVVVDADGTKRIIVRKIRKTLVTRQQMIHSHRHATQMISDGKHDQSISQITLKEDKGSSSTMLDDGGVQRLEYQTFGGQVITGLPGSEVTIQEFTSRPGMVVKLEEGLNPEEILQLAESDGNARIQTSSSSVTAVVQQVTKRIVKTKRRIIRRVVIIDGKEHVTEEVIDEPDNTEVFEEQIPKVLISVKDQGGVQFEEIDDDQDHDHKPALPDTKKDDKHPKTSPKSDDEPKDSRPDDGNDIPPKVPGAIPEQMSQNQHLSNEFIQKEGQQQTQSTTSSTVRESQIRETSPEQTVTVSEMYESVPDGQQPQEFYYVQEPHDGQTTLTSEGYHHSTFETSSSNTATVVQKVTRKITRTRRRIIKHIQIIDGKEHIREEVIDEPDDVEVIEEEPKVSTHTIQEHGVKTKRIKIIRQVQIINGKEHVTEQIVEEPDDEFTPDTTVTTEIDVNIGRIPVVFPEAEEVPESTHAFKEQLEEISSPILIKTKQSVEVSSPDRKSKSASPTKRVTFVDKLIESSTPGEATKVMETELKRGKVDSQDTSDISPRDVSLSEIDLAKELTVHQKEPEFETSSITQKPKEKVHTQDEKLKAVTSQTTSLKSEVGTVLDFISNERAHALHPDAIRVPESPMSALSSQDDSPKLVEIKQGEPESPDLVVAESPDKPLSPKIDDSEVQNKPESAKAVEDEIKPQADSSKSIEAQLQSTSVIDIKQQNKPEYLQQGEIKLTSTIDSPKITESESQLQPESPKISGSVSDFILNERAQALYPDITLTPKAKQDVPSLSESPNVVEAETKKQLALAKSEEMEVELEKQPKSPELDETELQSKPELPKSVESEFIKRVELPKIDEIELQSKPESPKVGEGELKEPPKSPRPDEFPLQSKLDSPRTVEDEPKKQPESPNTVHEIELQGKIESSELSATELPSKLELPKQDETELQNQPKYFQQVETTFPGLEESSKIVEPELQLQSELPKIGGSVTDFILNEIAQTLHPDESSITKVEQAVQSKQESPKVVNSELKKEPKSDETEFKPKPESPESAESELKKQPKLLEKTELQSKPESPTVVESNLQSKIESSQQIETQAQSKPDSMVSVSVTDFIANERAHALHPEADRWPKSPKAEETKLTSVPISSSEKIQVDESRIMDTVKIKVLSKEDISVTLPETKEVPTLDVLESFGTSLEIKPEQEISKLENVPAESIKEIPEYPQPTKSTKITSDIVMHAEPITAEQVQIKEQINSPSQKGVVDITQELLSLERAMEEPNDTKETQLTQEFKIDAVETNDTATEKNVHEVKEKLISVQSPVTVKPIEVGTIITETETTLPLASEISYVHGDQKPIDIGDQEIVATDIDIQRNLENQALVMPSEKLESISKPGEKYDVNLLLESERHDTHLREVKSTVGIQSDIASNVTEQAKPLQTVDISMSLSKTDSKKNDPKVQFDLKFEGFDTKESVIVKKDINVNLPSDIKVTEEHPKVVIAEEKAFDEPVLIATKELSPPPVKEEIIVVKEPTPEPVTEVKLLDDTKETKVVAEVTIEEIDRVSSETPDSSRSKKSKKKKKPKPTPEGSFDESIKSDIPFELPTETDKSVLETDSSSLSHYVELPTSPPLESPKPSEDVLEPKVESLEPDSFVESERSTEEKGYEPEETSQGPTPVPRKRQKKRKVHGISEETTYPKESTADSEDTSVSSPVETVEPDQNKKGKKKKGKKKPPSEPEEVPQEPKLIEEQKPESPKIGSENVESPKDESYHTMSETSDISTVKIVEECIQSSPETLQKDVTTTVTFTVPVVEEIPTQEYSVQTSPELTESIKEDKEELKLETVAIELQTSPTPVTETVAQTTPREEKEVDTQTFEEIITVAEKIPVIDMEIQTSRTESPEKVVQSEATTQVVSHDIVTPEEKFSQTSSPLEEPKEKEKSETPEIITESKEMQTSPVPEVQKDEKSTEMLVETVETDIQTFQEITNQETSTTPVKEVEVSEISIQTPDIPVVSSFTQSDEPQVEISVEEKTEIIAPAPPKPDVADVSQQTSPRTPENVKIELPVQEEPVPILDLKKLTTSDSTQQTTPREPERTPIDVPVIPRPVDLDISKRDIVTIDSTQQTSPRVYSEDSISTSTDEPYEIHLRAQVTIPEATNDFLDSERQIEAPQSIIGERQKQKKKKHKRKMESPVAQTPESLSDPITTELLMSVTPTSEDYSNKDTTSIDEGISQLASPVSPDRQETFAPHKLTYSDVVQRSKSKSPSPSKSVDFSRKSEKARLHDALEKRTQSLAESPRHVPDDYLTVAVLDPSVEKSYDAVVHKELDDLKKAITKHDPTKTERSVIVIIETISIWLEEIQYRIQKETITNGRSVNETQRLDSLHSYIQRLKEIIEITEVNEEIVTLVEMLTRQADAVGTLNSQSPLTVKEVEKDWIKFLNETDKLQESVEKVKSNLDDIILADIPTQQKLEKLDKLENINLTNSDAVTKMFRRYRILVETNPKRECPANLYTCDDDTKQVENSINTERDRLLQLSALAEEYEQTLQDFGQITDVAEALVDGKIIISDLEHLHEEIQKHRKFFVNLSHCRAILESLEDNLDSETRSKYSSLHNSLHDRATAIIDRAAGRAQQMTLAASRWTTLEQGMKEEQQWLRVAQQRVPDLTNVTSIDHEQYINLYQSVSLDVSHHHAKILRLLSITEGLQNLIVCSGLESECSQALDTLLRLQEDVDSRLIRLTAFKENWMTYDYIIERIENWMKTANRELEHITPDNITTTGNLRRFWELKAQHEVHNNLRNESGTQFEKALEILPISDEMVQRQFFLKIEDEWRELAGKIDSLHSSAIQSISDRDVSSGEKLNILEDEIRELRATLDSLKAVIRSEDELNLYIERLQVMTGRVDRIQNELGRLSLLPTAESDRLGALLSQSRNLDDQIAEELERSMLLKEKIVQVQAGITRCQKSQRRARLTIEECEAAERLGSDVVERASETCERLLEDLAAQWRDIRALNQALHTLPTCLRVSVSLTDLEKDINALQVS